MTEVEQHLGPQVDVLAAVVDYGTNLLTRLLLLNTTNDIHDMVCIATLGRQILASLDSVEQLSRAGSGQGARIVARSLLESSITLEWVLQPPEGERRAKCHYVGGLRRELHFCLRVTPGTPERQR